MRGSVDRLVHHLTLESLQREIKKRDIMRELGVLIDGLVNEEVEVA